MVVSKNRGYPKMDGENNGKPNEQMDDLGGKPTIFGNTHIESFGIFVLNILISRWLVSNMFYVHPKNWGNDPISRIFFRWVETTN